MIMISIDIGRNIFHLNNISISYRNRGYVARTQIINTVMRIIIFKDINDLIGLKNIIVDIIDKINILKYSDKKIKANHPPIYSTLNPDTNSDSPSAKSNGLRLVSAIHEENHIKKRIIFPQKNFNRFWEFSIWIKE